MSVGGRSGTNSDACLSVTVEECSVNILEHALQIKLGDTEVGQIEAYLIDRPELRQESKCYVHTHLLAAFDPNIRDLTDIFDRHGQLRRHLHGTFRDECDWGSLIYVHNIILEEAYQHQGMGCKALKLLLQLLNRPSAEPTHTSWHFAGAIVKKRSVLCPSVHLYLLSSCFAVYKQHDYLCFLQLCTMRTVRKAGGKQASEFLTRPLT